MKTTADRYAATAEKLRMKGVRIPPRQAWKRTIGRMKDCPIHEAAVRAGAEWRAEVNRKSLEELNADS